MAVVLLAIVFLVIAAVYASVGLGGGSSYLAVALLWGIPVTTVPVIALGCNVVVVTGSSLRYVHAGHFRPRLLLPFLATSIPCAYLGGALPVGETELLALASVALSVAGIQLIRTHREHDIDPEKSLDVHLAIAMTIGAILGFVSGIVGIGGGIFLAPVLYHLRAGTPKEIATACTLFILVNSLAGLAGQLGKEGATELLLDYWFLPVAVLIGGQIGNHLTLKVLPRRTLALITGCLVLVVGINLGARLLGLW